MHLIWSPVLSFVLYVKGTNEMFLFRAIALASKHHYVATERRLWFNHIKYFYEVHRFL